MVTSSERVQEERILGTRGRIKFSNNREMIGFSNSSLVPTLAGIGKESEEKTGRGRGGREEPQICWEMGLPNTFIGMLTFSIPHFLLLPNNNIKKDVSGYKPYETNQSAVSLLRSHQR